MKRGNVQYKITHDAGFYGAIIYFESKTIEITPMFSSRSSALRTAQKRINRGE